MTTLEIVLMAIMAITVGATTALCWSHYKKLEIESDQ